MNIIIFCMYSIPFFIVSLIHLIASQIDNEQLRSKTKPFLMPFLIFAVLLYTFMQLKVFSITQILLCIALIFGWIGDIYLLGTPSKSHFAKGAGAFLIGHCLYLAILIILYEFSIATRNIAILIILIYICILLIAKKKIHFPHGILGLELAFYAIILCSTSCISLIVLVSHFTATTNTILSLNNLIIPQTFIIFAGGILFLISDTLLSFVTFINHFKHCDTLVMVTYISAQFLLALGISMC